MNSKHCEKCHGPMVFAGSFASGRLECPRCKNEAWMQEVDANIKALNQAKQLSDEEQEDNKGLGSYTYATPPGWKGYYMDMADPRGDFTSVFTWPVLVSEYARLRAELAKVTPMKADSRTCTECGAKWQVFGAYWRGRWYCAACNVNLCRKLG